MFFKDEHIIPIISGKKTQTRRRINRTGKCPYKPGHAYQCRDNYSAGAFAHILIKSVRQERLGDITDEDAIREGYPTRIDYFAAFEKIYKRMDPDEIVWVIDFEVISVLDYLALKSKQEIRKQVESINKSLDKIVEKCEL
jgi:hypothetical protein